MLHFLFFFPLLYHYLLNSSNLITPLTTIDKSNFVNDINFTIEINKNNRFLNNRAQTLNDYYNLETEGELLERNHVSIFDD